MNKIFLVFLCLLAVIPYSYANTVQNVEQKDIATLFKQAVNEGESKGEVIGPFRDRFRTILKSPDATFIVKMTKVAALREEGCNRMKMDISSPGKYIKNPNDNKVYPIQFWIEVNLCEGGRFPSSANGALPK